MNSVTISTWRAEVNRGKYINHVLYLRLIHNIHNMITEEI